MNTKYSKLERKKNNGKIGAREFLKLFCRGHTVKDHGSLASTNFQRVRIFPCERIQEKALTFGIETHDQTFDHSQDLEGLERSWIRCLYPALT
jgi:hypothetical protein